VLSIVLLLGFLGFLGLQVRGDVDELLRSEGLEALSDDDRLQHLLTICQSTKVYKFICSILLYVVFLLTVF